MFSFTFLYKVSCICNFAIFVRIFMKFSPKCRTKQLGMIYTILGSFCSFFNCGKGLIFCPKIRPRKIPALHKLINQFCKFGKFRMGFRRKQNFTKIKYLRNGENTLTVRHCHLTLKLIACKNASENVVSLSCLLHIHCIYYHY